jgi:molybdopterin-guanine dinucleotide biosynthesis protein A
MTYDGIVLAGGAGRRLGGRHKPAIPIGGRRLLDVALAALCGAETVVAVGPPLATAQPVRWTRESPAGGGPVAALQAALPLLGSPAVVVLAADLPFVTCAAIDELVAAHREPAAATMAVDDGGRLQPLLACYDVARLVTAVPADATGMSMRALLAVIEAAGDLRGVMLGGTPPVTWDCDTATDLIRTQELV